MQINAIWSPRQTRIILQKRRKREDQYIAMWHVAWAYQSTTLDYLFHAKLWLGTGMQRKQNKTALWGVLSLDTLTIH